MAASPAPAAHVHRADRILTATIALVGVLVLGLLFVLALGAQIHTQQDAARIVNRQIRNEAIAFTQAHADATSAQRNFLLGGNPTDRTAFFAAETEARRHLAEVQRNAADPELRGLSQQVVTLAEQDFALLEEGLTARHPRASTGAASALRDATEDLHTAVLRHSDAIRNDQEAVRARLDSIAIALAILSLVMSGLAILALRRERAQWERANAALTDAHAKAAASDIAKTRFLAAASHDMRQPLHALSLYIGALQRRVEGIEARDILSKMERAAHSLSGMFATLLDLARIQADVVQPEIEAFALQEVIDRVVAEQPGAQVSAQLAPYEVRTDPLLLERLLRNLVSNALKHGGDAARIEVRPLALSSGAIAEISVIDQGPGIKGEDQTRIFDEFVRLDGRAGGEGLGLGLAIVKRIADLLSLDLHLRSAPGEGATFSVRVPMTASIPIIAPRAPSDGLSMRGRRVLIMDDDPLALEAAAGALRDMGAEVRACAREADVDAVLRDGFTPHLMVMDLRIDGVLAGVDIANRARTRLTEPPRVIMVTGDTAPETLTALRASGHQWLIKPVNPRDLIEAVETAAAG